VVVAVWTYGGLPSEELEQRVVSNPGMNLRDGSVVKPSS
jgi:hypothetical protein